MTDDAPGPAQGLEVRTYFVRGRNALVARADFSDLYVDYYLHQGQHSYQHDPRHDEMLKEALAAQTLHSASRPRNEVCAWTIHFQEPLLNLFVSGNNRLGTVVGQLFTDNVKDKGQNLFLADVVRGQEAARRSATEFDGADVFRAVERYYEQSEQRPARYFRHGPEDFVMVSAQPDCDVAWLGSLDDERIRRIDRGRNARAARDALLPLGMRLHPGAHAGRARARHAQRSRGAFRRGDARAHELPALRRAPHHHARDARGVRRKSAVLEADFESRFGGIGRLFGREGLRRLAAAHVCVVGVGGVGSWTVEALARSGLGRDHHDRSR